MGLAFDIARPTVPGSCWSQCPAVPRRHRPARSGLQPSYHGGMTFGRGVGELFRLWSARARIWTRRSWRPCGHAGRGACRCLGRRESVFELTGLCAPHQFCVACLRALPASPASRPCDPPRSARRRYAPTRWRPVPQRPSPWLRRRLRLGSQRWCFWSAPGKSSAWCRYACGGPAPNSVFRTLARLPPYTCAGTGEGERARRRRSLSNSSAGRTFSSCRPRLRTIQTSFRSRKCQPLSACACSAPAGWRRGRRHDCGGGAASGLGLLELITPAHAIGEAFCEERERLGLAKALTTDVGRVGLNCFDYELTCQKVGRKGAPAARRTPWSQHIGLGRVWWHRSKLARHPRRAAAAWRCAKGRRPQIS